MKFLSKKIKFYDLTFYFNIPYILKLIKNGFIEI